MSDTPAGSHTLTEEPLRRVITGAAKDDSLASLVDQPNWDAWQEVIDHKLIEWGRDPDQLAEDELIPPTRESVQQATLIALWFRKQRFPPPLRVVPDGDGGIVLERWSESRTVSIEIDSQGLAEFVECCQGRVTQREPFDVEL